MQCPILLAILRPCTISCKRADVKPPANLQTANYREPNHVSRDLPRAPAARGLPARPRSGAPDRETMGHHVTTKAQDPTTPQESPAQRRPCCDRRKGGSHWSLKNFTGRLAQIHQKDVKSLRVKKKRGNSGQAMFIFSRPNTKARTPRPLIRANQAAGKLAKESDVRLIPGGL